jgi:hypothetical protein
LSLDSDTLFPADGKDDAYDEIQGTIKELEDGLNKTLVKLKAKLGFAFPSVTNNCN